MSEVRVRIAPSPSGFLHVGTARTAIVNWLFARHHGGKFILRIEDTDTDRSSASMVDAIISSLKWLGLDWDEGPIHQSDRADIYKKYLEKFASSSYAYKCFCTPAELDVRRKEAEKNKTTFLYDRVCLKLSPEEIQQKLDARMPYVLRLKVPEGETRFNDLVYGEMVRQNKDIDDMVVCRSDGRPIYNFAVVVDDHEMGITHIIRGNDHQTNTFKQVLLYQAMGLPVPQFAHLPLIFDNQRKKISKRDKAANASDYGREGYLPEAVVNYLSLLGWSPKDDREVMTMDELIAAFDIHGVNKSNAIFDSVKMRHINAEHLRRKTNHQLAELTAPLFISTNLCTKYGLETRWRYLMDVIGLLKDRCTTVNEFVEKGGYFFQPPISYDPKGVAKNFTDDAALHLESLAAAFERLTEFSHAKIEDCLKTLATEKGLGLGDLIHPTRLAVSGLTGGPGLYEMLELLGQKETVERMRTAVRYIQEKVGKDM